MGVPRRVRVGRGAPAVKCVSCVSASRVSSWCEYEDFEDVTKVTHTSQMQVISHPTPLPDRADERMASISYQPVDVERVVDEPVRRRQRSTEYTQYGT